MEEYCKAADGMAEAEKQLRETTGEVLTVVFTYFGQDNT